jgi:hypothetical protein
MDALDWATGMDAEGAIANFNPMDLMSMWAD